MRSSYSTPSILSRATSSERSRSTWAARITLGFSSTDSITERTSRAWARVVASGSGFGAVGIPGSLGRSANSGMTSRANRDSG